MRGVTQLFSGTGVQSGFLKCWACKLILSLKEGFCELKFSNLEA